jgi:hypothetical protein
MQPTPDQETPAHGADAALDIPLEAPVDDAAEQLIIADPGDDADLDVDAIAQRGLEVDERDAVEQARPAGLDDDYR